MIRIAVCDDNLEFLERESELIERWSEQSRIPVEIFRFDNGDALIAKNNSVRMDIIFLDIIMPLQNGIDTARELRQSDPVVKIIFLTSSPEYALESYDVKARGYLLKPVSYDKIREVLDDCCYIYNEEPKNIILKTPFGYQKVFFHDIEYAEAQNKKVNFYLQNGKMPPHLLK